MIQCTWYNNHTNICIATYHDVRLVKHHEAGALADRGECDPEKTTLMYCQILHLVEYVQVMLRTAQFENEPGFHASIGRFE